MSPFHLTIKQKKATWCTSSLSTPKKLVETLGKKAIQSFDSPVDICLQYVFYCPLDNSVNDHHQLVLLAIDDEYK